MELVKNRMDVEVVEVPSEEIKTSDGMGGGQVMVVLLNDNDTSMRFVVHVLQTVFELNHSQSESIMALAHNTGSAIIGHYSEKKGSTATSATRRQE